MNRGARHSRQRSNRVRLKADAEALLGKLAQVSHTEHFLDEIAEMRVRLAPKPGVPAPIVLTGYTTRRPHTPLDDLFDSKSTIVSICKALDSL